jgi:hypothetical protein
VAFPQEFDPLAPRAARADKLCASAYMVVLVFESEFNVAGTGATWG